jgi:hypothetical protein
VPDFCTCGAQLPPDARFCHKCGKPQYDYPGLEDAAEPVSDTPVLALPPQPQLPPEITFRNRLAVRAGLIAAIAAVILSVVPLPFMLLRLTPFLAGGFFAVFLYSRGSGHMLSVRSGARMGWITGILSFAIVGMIVTVCVIAILNNPDLLKEIQTQLQNQLPPNDARSSSIAQAFSDPAKVSEELLQSLVVLFVVLTALPMIGGALGAKFLAKEGS